MVALVVVCLVSVFLCGWLFDLGMVLDVGVSFTMCLGRLV